MVLAEEDHFREHLAQYSRTYYTLDYEEFTSEWIVAELQCVPYVDSTALLLPSDPFMTLFKLREIETLKPYDDILETNADALSLLKETIRSKASKEKLRTERAADVDVYPPTRLPTLDLDLMLTCRSRKHLKMLGKGRYRKELPSDLDALKTTHIPSALAIDDVETPQLPVDELLNVIFQPPDRDMLRKVFEPVLKLYKKTEQLDDQAYTGRFDLGVQGDIDIPETRFMTMFPRNRRPGYLSTPDAKATIEPRGWAELPNTISEVKLPSSDDSISHQNMRVVDGWETIYTSPPSSQESHPSTDSNMIDELGMPSTPDTDPPLVEQIQNSQQDPPLFPRSRRIGGRDGIQPHILKGATIGSFLSSVLPAFPEVKPEPADAVASSPNPGTSVAGQASIKDEVIDPNLNDDVDTEIQRLCSQAALYSELLEDRIEDKTFEFLDIPALPEPTEHRPHSWIPTAVQELVTPTPVTDGEPSRVLMKKAPGKHSISLSLSWATFSVTEKLPPLVQILDVETPMDSKYPELLQSTASEVDQLFRKYGIPLTVEGATGETLDSPEPYLAILDGNSPLIESLFDQSLLLLSRQERYRTSGKRKSENEGEIEGASSPVPGDPELPGSKSSHRPIKRLRTYSPSSSPLPPSQADGEVEVVDLPPYKPALIADFYSEEDKENWDPSSDSNSDPIDPPLDIFASAPFEQIDPLVGHTTNSVPFATQEDYDMESQLKIEDFDDEPAYDTFDPLLTETQPYPPAVNSPSLSPRMPPLNHSPVHESNKSSNELPEEASETPWLAFDAQQVNKSLFTHSMGILDFARLRSVKVTESRQDQKANIDIALTELPHNSSSVTQGEEVQTQTAPPDLFDKNTISISDLDTAPASSTHCYLASLDVLQKRALVKSLNSSDCLVGLIERTTLSGVHLIIDCSTAIMFVPLLALPSEGPAWIERIAIQSWKYTWIHIVFEAYPESCALKSTAKASELYAYTPPILKAVKKFRRDIIISEACNGKSNECLVTVSFANSVLDTARFVRHVGNLAEGRDITAGAIWGDRQWLEDEHEDEQDLQNVAGLNPFSSALILSQFIVEEFLGMSSQARFDFFGPYLGVKTLSILNEDIESRYERSREAYQSSSSCDEALWNGS